MLVFNFIMNVTVRSEKKNSVFQKKGEGESEFLTNRPEFFNVKIC